MNSLKPKRLSLIKRRSDFILVADSFSPVAGGVQYYKIRPDSVQQVGARHSGAANALFADGHVAAEKPAYFETLGSTWQGPYMNNKDYQVHVRR